jgi:RHH-type transcriptional regulator, rel operon repressor / antitoxin RelB
VLKQTVTFRISRKKVREPDRLAETFDRDRSLLLNEAVDQYLSMHEHHLRQIKEGLSQARAGKLLDYEEVKAGWKKRLVR